MGTISIRYTLKWVNKMVEKKVLIVEDNEQSMELFRDLLISKGYTVIEAMDGEVALEKALIETPDLILMDIQIPKIDGVEVTRRMRNYPALNNTVIIAVTAHAMKGDRESFLKAGFNDYIAKPINIKAFLQTIENYLQPVV
ncbi:MAG: response regulator [Deltaproteobacteria bacterium]